MDSAATRLIHGLTEKRMHTRYLIGVLILFFVLVAISAGFY